MDTLDSQPSGGRITRVEDLLPELEDLVNLISIDVEGFEIKVWNSKHSSGECIIIFACAQVVVF